MTRRTLKWLLLSPLLLLVLLATLVLVAAYSLLHTETGVHWALEHVVDSVPGSLKWDGLEGNLGDGLVLHGVHFQNAEMLAGIERIELSAGVKLSPVAIRLRRVALTNTRIESLSEPAGEPQPIDLEHWLPELAVPFAVEIDELEVNGFDYLAGNQRSDFRLDSLAAKASLGNEIDIERLELSAPQARLSLSGSLGLSAPFPLESVIDVESAAPIDGGPDEFALHAEFNGELDRYRFVASAVAAAAEAGLEQTSVELAGEGNSAGLQFESLAVSETWLDLSARGGVQWADELKLSLDAGISHLDPAAWLPQWPLDDSLQADIVFTLSTDGLLNLTHVRVGAASSAMSLRANGLIDLNGGIAEGQIDWDELVWPPASLEPEMYSRQGSVTLSGSPEDWRLNGTASLQPKDLPEGELELEAEGNLDCGTVRSLQGAILGGQVSGQGEYCWSGGDFRASLLASELKTGALSATWPGTVNLQAEASGRVEPLQLSLELERLDGNLRDLPVNASGRLVLTGKELHLDDVLIRSGGSTLELNGNTAERQGLRFVADIDALGSLLPGSDGAIDAQGIVSLHPQQPRLSLELEADDLSIGGLQIDRLEIRDNDHSGNAIIADLLLRAEQLQVAEKNLDRLETRLLFSSDHQELALTAGVAGLELSAELRGAFESIVFAEDIDWENLSSQRWQGELALLRLTSEQALPVDLIGPASLVLSAHDVSVSSACLTAGGDSSLCVDVDANWKDGAAGAASMRLQELPLQWLLPLLGIDLQFTQAFSGELEFRKEQGGEPSANASVRLSPGEVLFTDDPEALLKTGEGNFGFSLVQGRLMAGSLDLPLPGNGNVDMDLKISDVAALGDAALGGRVHVLLEDLGALVYFVEGLDHAEGRFETDLDLGGTLNRPVFRGTTTLSNGIVEHHSLGLRFTDIQLSGESNGSGQLETRGSFRAREGQGELSAIMDFSDAQSPHILVSLSGSELTLMDAPDLKIVAVPDIQLALQNDVLEVAGSLAIPSALLAPAFIPSNPASESPDLVIVAGQIPGKNGQEEQESRMTVRGSLDMILGQDVKVDLGLALLQLGGQANFAWRDQSLPVTNGEVTMVGQIEAYGQSLRVTDGAIAWRNSPANNPQLNIRAERQIYGNSEVRRAGVFVTGTPRRLVIEPFTDPMTNRERAQTLLITGSDFNMEKGVGAVDIGTYIAPRLFVSYGIGVFEDDNVISIRYDLGRNWGVKATSGQRGTGVDISYTIDR